MCCSWGGGNTGAAKKPQALHPHKMPFLVRVLEDFVFQVSQGKDVTCPGCPSEGKAALFLHTQQGTMGQVVCQKSVTLPGTLCLELVNIVLMR